MNEVAEFFQSIMNSYGFFGCINVIAVLLLTWLIKIPLKRLAEKYSEENKVDKKVITCYFAFIPLVVSLLSTFVFYGWYEIKWDFSLFSWSKYLSETAVFSGLSIALYEIVDGFIKSYVAKAASATGLDTRVNNASKILTTYKNLKKNDKKIADKKKEIEDLTKKLDELKKGD